VDVIASERLGAKIFLKEKVSGHLRVKIGRSGLVARSLSSASPQLTSLVQHKPAFI
jgi:hypothetical protein